MSEDLDGRIIEEAMNSVNKKVMKEEAQWIAKRLGLAAVVYPQIIAKTFAFVFREEFNVIREELQALKTRMEKIEAGQRDLAEKLDKARQAFTDLKKSQTPPPRPQHGGRR